MTRTKNPVRFGINTAFQSFDDALRVCKAAEASGFTTIGFSDRPTEQGLEGWTIATAIGVLTQKLKLTHVTLNIPFRSPAMLAKMAASLDVVTGGGRVELSLGAGGQQPHYVSYGLPFGSAGERFEGLRDTVNILRGMWANDSFSYAGKVYHVAEASIGGAGPVNGPIPIWIGASGPRMMRYTGQVADGWMKNRGWPESTEQLKEMVGQLEAGANEAGRDPLSIRRVLNGGANIDAAGAKAAEAGVGGPTYLSANLKGSGQEIIEEVERWRDEGIDTFHLRFPLSILTEQLQQFGEEVVAKVK